MPEKTHDITTSQFLYRDAYTISGIGTVPVGRVETGTMEAPVIK